MLWGLRFDFFNCFSASQTKFLSLHFTHGESVQRLEEATTARYRGDIGAGFCGRWVGGDEVFNLFSRVGALEFTEQVRLTGRN